MGTLLVGILSGPVPCGRLMLSRPLCLGAPGLSPCHHPYGALKLTI